MKNIKLSILGLLIIFLFSCSYKQDIIQNSDKNWIKDPIKDITCIDEDEGVPVITSISANSGTIETKLEINGCNFSGFEGDKNVWIENEQGTKGILYSENDSTSKLIKVNLKSSICQNDNSYSGLPCDSWLELVPGKYKIYVIPWGKESNKVDFTIYENKLIKEESTNDILKKIFIEKYPKYSDTINIRINKEISNYIRGDVIFETGKPGGIFLATKIDGIWQIVFDGNGQISCDLLEYGFPDVMLYDCNKNPENNISYQEIIDYVDNNITEIINLFSTIKPANGKWFADGYGFTSLNNVYVDYEDGHYLYRALLECNKDDTIKCNTLAIFENNNPWEVIQGEDTQKDNSIIYKWAKDYEWER